MTVLYIFYIIFQCRQKSFINTETKKLQSWEFDVVVCVIAPMDQEILEFSFMMCGVQQLCISPLGAQFTKMATNGSEKAFCVLTFHEYRSVTIVQRQFRTKFGKQPPSDNSIRRWCAQFQETGCVCKRKSSGRPSVTEEQVEQVRQVHTSRFLLHTCNM